MGQANGNRLRGKPEGPGYLFLGVSAVVFLPPRLGAGYLRSEGLNFFMASSDTERQGRGGIIEQ